MQILIFIQIGRPIAIPYPPTRPRAHTHTHTHTHTHETHELSENVYIWIHMEYILHKFCNYRIIDKYIISVYLRKQDANLDFRRLVHYRHHYFYYRYYQRIRSNFVILYNYHFTRYFETRI